MTVAEMTDAAFAADVIERSRTLPVVVDFWATWCGPCRQLSPTIERIAADYDGSVVVVKMDVDANPRTAGTFGIQSIPTVMAFKDGKPVDGFLGAQPEAIVRDFFAGLVPSEDDRAVERAASMSDEQAAPILREILVRIVDHRGAILALARILGARGQADEAKALLARIPEDDEVRRVAAAADMAASVSSDLDALAAAASSDPAARVVYGRALAAAGLHTAAFEQLMNALQAGERDAARDVMLDMFALLGDEDPLTVRFRRELASALF